MSTMRVLRMVGAISGVGIARAIEYKSPHYLLLVLAGIAVIVFAWRD